MPGNQVACDPVDVGGQLGDQFAPLLGRSVDRVGDVVVDARPDHVRAVPLGALLFYPLAQEHVLARRMLIEPARELGQGEHARPELGVRGDHLAHVTARHGEHDIPPAQVAKVKAQFPKAWAWSDESAEACSSGYVLYGWTGLMPASCTGGTMIVPLDRQWEVWGWPNRTIQRMARAGGRIVVTGPHAAVRTGLSLPEQIGDIPSTFNGYLWVDDLWNVGPALNSSIDRRNGHQIDMAEKALAAPRAKQ